VGDFGRLRFEARLVCNLGLVHRQSDRLSAAIGNGLFLKRSGGEIEALAWIIAIDRFDPLDPAAFLRLAGDPMAAAYIRAKPRARYGVAFELAGVRRVVVAPERTPRKLRIGWVNDFGPGDWQTVG
jgi:hypothetical protein